jgi:DNA phosphorothioation-dependent restriction protein DptG
LELKQQKKAKDINMEEFKALVNNLIPTTLKQAEWICDEVDRLTHEHPELKEKFKEWNKMPESEKKELEEIINHILAEAEKAHQKW